MSHGSHDYADDPRNRDILIYVNGAMKRREEATVSVFDSGFVLGDGVWEGLRIVDGHPAFLDAHLDRLYEGAKAIAMDIGLDREALTGAIYRTLAANDMHDGVHVRLMVTRGLKRTPYQDPRVVIGPATIVIIPEYKNPLPEIDRARPQAVHRACASRLSRRAGSETQQPQQAQLHHGLHPGLYGRRRRRPDARSARLRRDLQFDPLLHRTQGRGLDFDRTVLPRRHHPVERAGGLPRSRNCGLREVLQPDRRLWRRRGLRHRHVRRRRAGPRDRRPHRRRRHGADRWSSASSRCTRPMSRATSPRARRGPSPHERRTTAPCASPCGRARATCPRR